MGRLFFILGLMGIVCLVTARVQADARTDYLLNLLENGSNYRIRVQAATTLGKLRSKEAKDALVRSLRDEHELVVISSITALGQIGDTSVIQDIEAVLEKTRSSAVKSQATTTLRVLRSLLGPETTDTVARGKPRYLIRVDAMGNSSAVQQKEVVQILHDVVISGVGREPDTTMQPAGMKNNQIKQKLKKDKLVGYILSGSLIRMEEVNGRMVVKIGLNVFTNPEYNLLMMPTAEGAVSISTGQSSREAQKAAQEKAIKAVADRLVSSVFKKIRQMDTR